MYMTCFTSTKFTIKISGKYYGTDILFVTQTCYSTEETPRTDANQGEGKSLSGRDLILM